MKRVYNMKMRAAMAEATRQRILEVTAGLLRTRFRSEIRLEDIALGAEVTVQTVLNVFGSRSVLLDEALTEMLSVLRAQRLRAEPGNTTAAIAALVDHYEEFGDLVIRNLVEQADPELIETGRIGHRNWVRRQFAPNLTRFDNKAQRTLVDALVCACDVYTWKLLRRDMGRNRDQTEATMRALVRGIADRD